MINTDGGSGAAKETTDIDAKRGGSKTFELLQINDEDYEEADEAEQDRHID